MIAQIQNINDSTFSLNGIHYKKVFLAVASGNGVRIICAYDSKLQILPPTVFSDVEVNGNTFNSLSDLIDVLKDVVFNGEFAGGISNINGFIIAGSSNVDIQGNGTLNSPYSISVTPLEQEGYNETGTRVGANLKTKIGDYDNSGNGHHIEVDDENTKTTIGDVNNVSNSTKVIVDDVNEDIVLNAGNSVKVSDTLEVGNGVQADGFEGFTTGTERAGMQYKQTGQSGLFVGDIGNVDIPVYLVAYGNDENATTVLQLGDQKIVHRLSGEDKLIVDDDGKIKILGELSINTQNNHPFNSSIYFPKAEDKDGSIINTFIDLTRNTSNSANNLYYGILRRVVYSGTGDLKELIGAYDIGRYTGSGDIASLMSKLNVTSYRGQGNVTNAIFGQQNRAEVENLTGNANINIVLGQENKVKINDDKATIEWVQGSSSSIEILAAADVKNAFVHRFDIDEINEPLDNLYILYQNETVIPPIKAGGKIYFLYSLMDVPSLISGELTAKSFISNTINENADVKAKSIVYNDTTKRFETAKNTTWQTLTIEDGGGNVNATGNLKYKIINNRLILNGTLTPTSETGNITAIGFLPAGFIPDVSRRIAIPSISNNSTLEVTTGTGLISLGNPELNASHLIDFECTLNIND